jgi:hypothetical protein
MGIECFIFYLTEVDFVEVGIIRSGIYVNLAVSWHELDVGIQLAIRFLLFRYACFLLVLLLLFLLFRAPWAYGFLLFLKLIGCLDHKLSLL